MFYGEFEHTLDNKGRFILPAKFRVAAKSHYVERFYMTRGLDNCLFMLPEDEWKLQEAKFKSMPFTRAQSRKFNRMYFAGAVEIAPDAQGRILIPKYLKDFAGIKADIMIIGVANRIEIWDRAAWNGFYEKEKGAFEENAENLFGNE